MFNSSFYNFLLNSYYFSKNKLDNIIIDYVNKNIDKKQQVDKLKDIIIGIMNNNDYKSVLEKNKLLINLFGHALNQMFPPYIATNVKDIKKFKKEIE